MSEKKCTVCYAIIGPNDVSTMDDYGNLTHVACGDKGLRARAMLEAEVTALADANKALNDEHGALKDSRDWYKHEYELAMERRRETSEKLKAKYIEVKGLTAQRDELANVAKGYEALRREMTAREFVAIAKVSKGWEVPLMQSFEMLDKAAQAALANVDAQGGGE